MTIFDILIIVIGILTLIIVGLVVQLLIQKDINRKLEFDRQVEQWLAEVTDKLLTKVLDQNLLLEDKIKIYEEKTEEGTRK